MSPAKLQRLGHTLRHLKVAQLSYFMIRRGLPAASARAVVDCSLRGSNLTLPLLPVDTFRHSESDFEFLHAVQQVDADSLDWNPDGQSRLWRYHLHYFDMLRDSRRSPENKQYLIEDWIENNPQGSQPAWEPYTASLRIVNWIGFFLAHEQDQDAIPPHWLSSLYQQVLWLEKNDERHILANHYFENIKAWLFAGLFFSGPDADRWLKKAQKLLSQQLSEQFLDDGGHYERSPHYHALMIENVLDLYNLVSVNAALIDDDLIQQLKSVADAGLAMLDTVLYPGDQLPLFNDSAKETETRLAPLFQYGAQLVGFNRQPASETAQLVSLPDTGLYGVRDAENMLLIDCGEIGPDYQPGHTHCDFLSYELIIDGEPVVVDSGLYEYQGGEMRSYVRSTAAHNTVTVDGFDQSEVWGEFRVARRARKSSALAKLSSDGVFHFDGEFVGFPQIKGGVAHQRRVKASLGSGNPGFSNLSVEVRDSVTAAGQHRLESFIHFHPDVQLYCLAAGEYQLSRSGEYLCHLCFDPSLDARIEEGWYCPSFGLKYTNTVLVLGVELGLEAEAQYLVQATFGYRFERRIL